MKTINTSALENRLQLLESYIPNYKDINTNVSKAGVAWHLDHSLKVINAVVKNMENSDPNLYEDNFKFVGKVLLKLGFFPRGKAKAPKYVKPPEVILKSAIITQLAEAKQNIKEIQNLNENAYFKHPLFGNTNKFRVVRFLDTHTNHHLKIVKKILK
ncbi:DUF1569 domain-containing protein [Polaribacter uvawellassae]|uniref:DUF1569 domain-containing protein n=1 Tax=Polaribacter uvawellassae TaxID=3133495 RepID=UPI00321A45AF